MLIALGAAIAGAVAYGVGSVLQAYAARHAAGAAVLRHPAYLVGMGFDVLGFLASLVAVRGLPLFAVQSVLAGSLAVTVLLARVILRTRIRGRDAATILLVVGALAVLAMASGPQAAQPPPTWFAPVALLGMGAAAALLVGHYNGGNANRLAALAGTSFAGSVIGARALDLHGAWFAVLGDPIAWTIAGFGLIGSLAYARSLEHGSVGSVTATVWVIEVAVAGLVGITALGDHVLPGWQVPALGAVIIATVGCVLLAGAQPADPEYAEGNRSPHRDAV